MNGRQYSRKKTFGKTRGGRKVYWRVNNGESLSGIVALRPVSVALLIGILLGK